MTPPRREFPCCPTCHGHGALGECPTCGGSGYAPWQEPMTREEALKVYRGQSEHDAR